MHIHNIPDSLFKPHTMTAAFNRKQDVIALRDTLSGLGLNGRHMHVLHGASGLLTLNGRRDVRKQTLLARLLNFLLSRVQPSADLQGIETLQQGGWVVLIDLPQDPSDRRLIQAAFHRAGAVGVTDPDRPLPEAPQPNILGGSVSPA
ncbi:hypothetical protein [Deinococcus peraridilitoris]|uniref:Uncharacterized protein n=1 Tax=Deinococcus peraridilitoris (strain DSM 19664 / LMG 22246 / CIP 109416 / KR-200) TaxID=937777 RepID=L0A0Q6_DEIPD|nr:hypothetical protein [Deinococcus peraridilitoris]AFZ67039.1 hypothetical protein Deipe_1498 [Deinococcus peraridilitoris DSM 19664]